MKKNAVYIGCSIDGYIADKNGGLGFLEIIPDDGQSDMGYSAFMETIDAILMGRNSYETVRGFDTPWPYKKPVFVLSNTLKNVPDELKETVFFICGTIKDVLSEIHSKGFESLYIDGGRTVQNFLKEDLVDEMTITTIPILIGGGTVLFGELPKQLEFELIESKTFRKHIVQRHYKRKR